MKHSISAPLSQPTETVFAITPRFASLIFVLWASAFFALIASAADWPRLGGPDGFGTSTERQLARSWPEAGPAIQWKVEVGEGFAGPAIYAGQVFLLDRASSQKDCLRCLELDSGRELWRLAYDAPGTLPFNGSRNTPTVNGDYILALGPFGHLYCIDRLKHSVKWSKNLIQDFKGDSSENDEPTGSRAAVLARVEVPMWGLTQAPLIYRDLVIVAPQTPATGLVAYELATGRIRWRSGYIGRNWYSHVSPALVTLCGRPQVVMLAQPSDPEKAPEDAPPAVISSTDPATGAILWTNQTPRPYKIPIPQPLCVGEDRLFITGGYKLGCFMLKVAHTQGTWETKVLFQSQAVAAHIHSPVLYKDHIYVSSFKEHGGKSSGLVCLALDGETQWQTGPWFQFDSGPFLIADDLAFVLNGRTGQLALLDLSETTPKRLAQCKVLDAVGGNVWAPMALADGKLLVRDQHELRCLRVGFQGP